jgi:phage host-nuclease inhibitor protein Gam
MNDSTSQKAELPKRFMETLNDALKEYFDVRRDRAALKLKQEKKQAKLSDKFAQRDAPLVAREAELKEILRGLLIPNKAMLLSGKLRSFKTTYGEVFFTKKRESTSFTDTRGLEAQARKDRNLKALGKFKRTWSPNLDAVVAFIKNQPKAVAEKYEPFLSTSGGFDELSVRPNEPYITEFDPNRLSYSKVKLGPAPDPVSQDKSPDA